MIDEFKKSINNILYERVTSPFYGTFIISWLIWNWNIVYLTLFVSEKSLKVSKIVYINSNLIDYCKMIWYPLASSALLILVLPFVANGAFYVNLKFTVWKRNQKQKIEGDELLTKAESFALRQEILEQENKFLELLASKQNEIEQLKGIINNPAEIKNLDNEEKNEINTLTELVEKIKNSNQNLDFYNVLLRNIQLGSRLNPGSNLSASFISLLEGNNIIIKKDGSNVYEFTEKGKKFQLMMLDKINDTRGDKYL
jgi:hypothetical protein